MYYLIDTENVGNPGLDGIEQLSESDTVELFVTEKSNSLQIDTVQHMMKSKAEILFTTVACGHANALDFQLITKLFCTIDPDISYIVIAKDKGYDTVILMAASLGYTNIRRAETISDAITPPPPKPKKKPLPIPQEQKTDPVSAAKAHLKEKLGITMSDSSIEFILKAAGTAKTKQAFYAMFVQKYGQETGQKNYTNIKSEYDWFVQLVK